MSIRPGTSAAALCALVLSLTTLATRPASGAANIAATESAALKNAYVTLSKADHDYKGHRRAAMLHVESACKLLGTPIKGDGKAGEAQGLSDDQLRSAQSLIQSARSVAAANGQKQVLAQIDAALTELNTALSIK